MDKKGGEKVKTGRKGKFPTIFGKKGKFKLKKKEQPAVGGVPGRTVQANWGEKIWTSRKGEDDFSYLWAVYKIASISSDKKSVFLMDELTKKVWEVPADQTLSYDESHDSDETDLTRLNYLHEASLLHSLQKRYMDDEIYTFFGDTLISVNPYHDIPGLYHKQVEQNEPHVFSVAERALNYLQKRRKSQSIIINGDSGAGKTEAAKQVMQHLVALASNSSSETTPEVENLVLASTPVLEAFGNSITLRNDNSSRFGRFIQILYDDSGTKITGMNTLHFLLEKSRLISRSPGERNYHILYQLCAAASDLGFKDATTYNYLLPVLSSSNYTGVIPDDTSMFAKTKESLDKIGISEQVQTSIWRVLLAVLSLGNIEFVTDVENDTANTGRCKIVEESREFLEACSNALDLPDPVELEVSLISRTMEVAGNLETTKIYLNVEEAVDSRDALAKFLYSKVFDWVVEELNRQSQHKSAKSEKTIKKKERFIGILDIFGFEDLEHNSFEQICVNFANELLQKQFDLHVVESERNLFQEEGVEFPNIDLPSIIASEQVLAALTKVVFGSLEEQCLLRSGSDSDFLAAISKAKTNNKVTSDWKSSTGFVVKHFAGEVTYDSDGFIEKNRDALTFDLRNVVTKTTNEILIQELNISNDTIVARDHKMAASETVLKKFQADMKNLISTLTSTDKSFIRCIKPNHFQSSKEWDVKLILAQLEYLGILQAIRVHEDTYPVRRDFSFIPLKYYFLLEEDGKLPMKHEVGVNDKEVMRLILNKFLGEDSEFKLWQCGHSKVFLGNEVLYRLDAIVNERRLEELAKMSEKEREMELENERKRQEKELKLAKQQLAAQNQEILEKERLRLKEEEEKLRQRLKEKEEEMAREQAAREAAWKKKEEEMKRQQDELLQAEIERQRQLLNKEREEQAKLAKERERIEFEEKQKKLKDLEDKELQKKIEIECLAELHRQQNEDLAKEKQELVRRKESANKNALLQSQELASAREALKAEQERIKLLEENNRLKEKLLLEEKARHALEKESLEERERQIWQEKADETAAKLEKQRRKAKLKRKRRKLKAAIKIQATIRGFIIRRNYLELQAKSEHFKEVLNEGEFVIFSSIIINEAPLSKRTANRRKVMMVTTKNVIMIVDPVTLKVDQKATFNSRFCRAVAAGRDSLLEIYFLSDWLATKREDWAVRDLINEPTTWVAVLTTLCEAKFYIKRGFFRVIKKKISRNSVVCPIKFGALKIIDEDGDSSSTPKRRGFKMFKSKAKDEKRNQFVLTRKNGNHALIWYENEKDEEACGSIALSKNVKVLVPNAGSVNGRLNVFMFCLRVRKANKDKLFSFQTRGKDDRDSWVKPLRKIIQRDKFRKHPPVSSAQLFQSRRFESMKRASRQTKSTSQNSMRPQSMKQRPKSTKNRKSFKNKKEEEKPTSRMKSKRFSKKSKNTSRKSKGGTLRRLRRSLSLSRTKSKQRFEAETFLTAFEDEDHATGQNMNSTRNL